MPRKGEGIVAWRLQRDDAGCVQQVPRHTSASSSAKLPQRPRRNSTIASLQIRLWHGSKSNRSHSSHICRVQPASLVGQAAASCQRSTILSGTADKACTCCTGSLGSQLPMVVLKGVLKSHMCSTYSACMYTLCDWPCNVREGSS